jgi:hypothetical protein
MRDGRRVGNTGMVPLQGPFSSPIIAPVVTEAAHISYATFLRAAPVVGLELFPCCFLLFCPLGIAELLKKIQIFRFSRHGTPAGPAGHGLCMQSLLNVQE